MEIIKIIKKVCKNISNGQLFVTVPRNKGIKEEDYVEIKKVD